MAITNANIVPSKAPNLPIAPVDYAQTYQDQLNNAFRLYFTQLDNVTQYTAAQTIIYTVAALPAVGVMGRRAFVSDATSTSFSTTVVGGGTNPVPVFDNGTAWIIG